MRIKLILFIFSVLIFNGQGRAQFDPDFFDNYTVVPGQPSMPAVGVFKDSQGFIWGCYIGGLYRFDGISMKQFTRIPGDTNSLADNLVRSILFEDSLNRLWISNFSNDIDILDKHTGKIIHIKPDKSRLKNKKFGGLKGGCLDEQGNVIGYALGSYLVKYDMTRNIVETILISPEHPDSNINKVNTIFKDRDNQIWIGTWRGLILYNAEDNSFRRPVLPEQGSDLLKFLYITDMMQDDNGIYWIGTGNGLVKYDPSAFTITYFEELGDRASSIIWHVHEYPPDSGKTLLLKLKDGICFFDKKSGPQKTYIFNHDDPATTHMQVIYDEIVDETGRLWICSDNFKMIVFTPREDVFKKVQIIDELKQQYIGASFCKDEDGNLWVGTAYGGLYKFDTGHNIIDRFQFSPEDGWRNNYFFYSLFLDGETLWTGLASRGLGRLNIRTREFELIPSTSGAVGSPVYRIYEIIRDSFGVLWFCSANAIFYLDTNDPDAEVEKVRQVEGRDPFAMSAYEDNDGNLWFLAPGRGIYLLSLENRADTLFTIFNHDENDPASPITDQVSSICQDKKGNFWIGSDVGLLRYYPEDDSFGLFEYDDDNMRMAVSNLKRDNDGNLWGIAGKGIMRFSPEASAEKTFRLLNSYDGIPFTELYPWEFHMDQDGIIYCGAVRGSGNSFFYFNPEDLPENKFIPPVVLTSFQVRNEDFAMDTTINMVKEIDLKYHQNYFSFEFAALNYINAEGNSYAYMLEGYDEDWIYTGNRRFASYTGVPPGRYTFRAKGSNNDGYWNEEGTSVKIIITPPPWKTWWAYSIYAIVIILMLYLLRRYDLKRQRLKKDLEIEQVEAKKLKEVDKLKSQFFANISHEFRTPLTLILGPLEKLKARFSDPESTQDMNIMQRNALRLQRLINQLLNLSKIESGSMKLQAWEEDIVSLTRGYVQSFESLAQQRNIELSFKTDVDHQLIYLDRDKIEKILYNLLSNALKFTDGGGKVIAEVSGRNDHISIIISDTGSGISKEQTEHIFDRFYRAENSHHREGTGIGLALTKQLVELHHGEISVESEEGRGSAFIVLLKKGKEHLASGEIVNAPDSDIQSGLSPLFPSPDEDPPNEKNTDQIGIELLREDSKEVILIVEDNKDLRSYIMGYFNEDYQVVEAEDGEDGFSMATEILPDIIISDVMMPKVDGYQMCDRLKTDQRTSHIPLILLTARASTESKMEGLETGADDFITKPFDPQELQVRVKNLLTQRKRLSDYFQNNIGDPEIGTLITIPNNGISGLDREFLGKAITVIGINMGDADFGVEEFSNEMALSRVQLHRKLKGLLSMAPSELIRTIRLKKAAEMLKIGNRNVTEVAYEVGFNNLSYFAKCFQEKYGIPPSSYTENNK